MYIALFANAKLRADVLNDTTAASQLKGHLQSNSLVLGVRDADEEEMLVCSCKPLHEGLVLFTH